VRRAGVEGNDLAHLKMVVEKWGASGALELEVVRDDATAFRVRCCPLPVRRDVHRLGLGDLGPLLSCNRDGSMIAGFNPDIEFTRTQTIMQGATFCDFRYRVKPKPRD